jgi:hypothetical protein
MSIAIEDAIRQAKERPIPYARGKAEAQALLAEALAALTIIDNAVVFFDKVKAASQEEQIAVGHDHWDTLLTSARTARAVRDKIKGAGQ